MADPSRRPRVLIDTRKAFDSGIGTYIRSVIPRVVDLLPHVSFAALVEPGGAARHQYLDRGRVELMEVTSTPLGLREQFELRGVGGGADHFWATSLAHPLFARLPMIVTVHDVAQLATQLPAGADWLVKRATRVYFNSLRRTAKLMLFNSEFTRTEFAHYIGPARARTVVTPLGVEADWFDAPASRTAVGRPYLVCIGNLRPHKNLTVLLQAFFDVMPQLPHDLVLVGKLEGFRSTDTYTQSLLGALGTRVRFSGFLPEADLQRTVAGADALILPSLYEGFGLPALEAMAAGVQVFAARSASLPEVCGDCARYFDPLSRASLAQQLRQHAGMSDEARQRHRLAGIARAQSFTWDKTARLTADAIAATLEPPLGVRN